MNRFRRVQDGYYYLCFNDNISWTEISKILVAAYNSSKNTRWKFWGEPAHRQRRSLDTEVTVQLLVVVDRDMINFHGNQSVEEYVLTVMNMVSTSTDVDLVENKAGPPCMKYCLKDRDSLDVML